MGGGVEALSNVHTMTIMYLSLSGESRPARPGPCDGGDRAAKRPGGQHACQPA